VTESQGPHSSKDVRTLKQALVAFLADEQADWAALSRELTQLSDRQKTDERTREALLTLADHLAHADRAAGVPAELRKFLDSEEGRIAASVFQDAMSHHQAWVDFAREAERELGEQNP
jgi:hypothetical protein